MKKYTAEYQKKHLVLVSESRHEVGRIVENRKLFHFEEYITFDSKKYDIRNVGFLKNDVELFDSNVVTYFTDLAKERIIKSGEGVRIYYFKLKKTSQLTEKGKLLIEIREEKRRYEKSIFHLEVDHSVDDLLTLLFLYYSTKEFNSIGGDGD
ncbi:hypothetical protein HNP24_001718 [Chryseobacterium sediminis]|uniref:Uncharacterized protein n=1 Tax=Chryseobacterium sediminis TaxID=1679494 RepID=A0ABR6Q0Y1_9FLAO|nr:hypothetical protein [Chryseobacterium sediminis]MBB6330768.1 hypothetical protein [Chryseobacterium sediminis]